MCHLTKLVQRHRHAPVIATLPRDGQGLGGQTLGSL
jgi:hypothetical protein